MLMILFGADGIRINCPPMFKDYVFPEIRVRYDNAADIRLETTQDEGSSVFRVHKCTVEDFAVEFESWDADDYSKRPLVIVIFGDGEAMRYYPK